VAVSGAPSVEHELALSHRGYLTFAFALPLVGAALLEAGLALLSDICGRARLVVLGQVALAAALLFTAWTSDPWSLAFGLALAGASSGVACGAAQGLLFASNRESADRAMVRWSIYGAVGDLLTPLLTALAIALGHSYRGAMGALAVVVLAHAVLATSLLFRGSHAEHPGPDVAPLAEPLREVLARAIRLPRLWAWLFAAGSCTLLDEIVVALGALRLAHAGGTSSAMATGAAVTFSAGSLLGATITDRLATRFDSRRVLAMSAILCALALAALWSTGSPLASCAALFAVGTTCAPHHPLALARAYDELPDYPGTVQAMGQVFFVVEVVAPLAIGLAADRLGLGAAIGCLLVQPAVIFACAALLVSPAK
jgi:MFS family permease